VGPSNKAFAVRLAGLHGELAEVSVNGVTLPREGWSWETGGDLCVAGLNAPFELLVSGSLR
jgi:hypothetical protein